MKIVDTYNSDGFKYVQHFFFKLKKEYLVCNIPCFIFTLITSTVKSQKWNIFLMDTKVLMQLYMMENWLEKNIYSYSFLWHTALISTLYCFFRNVSLPWPPFFMYVGILENISSHSHMTPLLVGNWKCRSILEESWKWLKWLMTARKPKN